MTDPNAMAIQLAIVIQFLEQEQEARAKRRQETEAFFAEIEEYKASLPPEHWEEVRRDRLERYGPEAIEIEKEIRAVQLKIDELGKLANEAHRSADREDLDRCSKALEEMIGHRNLLDAKRRLAMAQHHLNKKASKL